MSGDALGSFHPGNGPLHRLSPGVKLMGLAVFSAAVVVAQQITRGSTGLALGVTALSVGVALVLTAGLRARSLARVARGFALVGALILAFQTWQHGWERGLAVVSGLLGLILAASAVTASTRAEDMMDTLIRALGPLRRFGVDPQRVGLSFSLALRALPEAAHLAREARDAARARGLSRHPRAILIPLVIRVVARARDTGAALEARGLGDP